MSRIISYHCSMNFTVGSEQDLGEIADALIHYIGDGYRVILLSGDMGSGKTTLAKVLCARLGVTEPVSSPTFSIVNEYHSPVAGVIYHMDLYRLEKTQDLEQIGFVEYLDSDHVCLVEWPDLGQAYIDMPHVVVKITVGTNNIRIFKISTYDTVDT